MLLPLRQQHDGVAQLYRHLPSCEVLSVCVCALLCMARWVHTVRPCLYCAPHHAAPR